MAKPNFEIEILKSSKGKEKACVEGYLYTLNKSCGPLLIGSAKNAQHAKPVLQQKREL